MVVLLNGGGLLHPKGTFLVFLSIHDIERSSGQVSVAIRRPYDRGCMARSSNGSFIDCCWPLLEEQGSKGGDCGTTVTATQNVVPSGDGYEGILRVDITVASRGWVLSNHGSTELNEAGLDWLHPVAGNEGTFRTAMTEFLLCAKSSGVVLGAAVAEWKKPQGES